MKKYLIWLILLPNAILANNALTDTAVIKLAELLNNITVIHANFNQTVTNKSGYILQEQAGTVQLAKPNLLNWQVLTPDHMLIVTDGNKIWNYDMDLEQVTVKDFSSEINNTKIASLLFGDANKLLSNFDVTYANKCDAYVCFHLNSNKNTNEDDAFVKADLGFNKNKQLVMFRLYDQLDQETVFNFTKYKNKIDPKVFKFITPEGVDVITD